MTVLCVNSSTTYADIAAADAAEGGTDYGVPTRFEQTGTSSSAVSFASADYASSLVYTATSSEKTTGDINVGAGTTSTINSLVSGMEVSDIRTGRLPLSNCPNLILRRLVVDAGGTSLDGVDFNDTIDAEDILIHNCNDGFLSSVLRTTSLINKCTVIDASRFGYAQGKFNNCVDVNSANQGYFSEQAGSTGLWEHDGSGTDTITESPATDIFENYAAGDYRIKASSSPGLAGAGAFINVSSGISITGTAVPTQTEADIVTGGKTIILTLTGDTFVSGTTSEDGIAAGSDSDIAASGTNWDSLIKGDLDNTNVVLSGGDTVATITLPAYATYDIPGTETITWTIPAASLTTSTSAIIATPTHTVTAVSGTTLTSFYYTSLMAGY